MFSVLSHCGTDSDFHRFPLFFVDVYLFRAGEESCEQAEGTTTRHSRETVRDKMDASRVTPLLECNTLRHFLSTSVSGTFLSQKQGRDLAPMVGDRGRRLNVGTR